MSRFLRSVIAQLSRITDPLPGAVQVLYSRYLAKGQQPDRHILEETLWSVMEELEHAVVILDALDECSGREDLLDLLIKTSCRPSTSLRLLATSRKEPDIEEALEDIVTKDIGIQNAIVDADIRLHVRRCLAKDPKLSKWSESVKEEIEISLVTSAQGM